MQLYEKEDILEIVPYSRLPLLSTEIDNPNEHLHIGKNVFNVLLQRSTHRRVIYRHQRLPVTSAQQQSLCGVCRLGRVHHSRRTSQKRNASRSAQNVSSKSKDAFQSLFQGTWINESPDKSSLTIVLLSMALCSSPGLTYNRLSG